MAIREILQVSSHGEKEILRLLQSFRLQNLTGFFLLLLPGLWGYSLVGEKGGTILLVALGSLWARSLGCGYNDWVDREIDRQVERTRLRPFVQGPLSLPVLGLGGVLFLVPALLFLVVLPLPAVFLGLIGVVGATIYPFMKRWCFFPQFFLGLLFSLNVWMPAAIEGKPYSWKLGLLFFASVLWTLFYDTLYAYQDYSDDKRLGIGSLAVWMGIVNGKIGLWMLLAMRYVVLALLVPGLFLMLLFMLEAYTLSSVALDSPLSCKRIFICTPWQGFLIALWIAWYRWG